MKFQANLKRQLQLIRMNSRPQSNSNQNTSTQLEPPQFNRQHSNASLTNEEGWVFVPSQNETDV